MRWRPVAEVLRWLYSWSMSGCRPAPRCADLDQVAVWIAEVGADLAAVVFGLGKKLRSPRRPLFVRLGDVRDADVHERAGAIRIRRGRQRDRRLVVGGTPADIEDEPGVRDLQDHWIPFQHHLCIKHRSIELAGSILIRYHQEISDDKTVGRRWKVTHIHLTHTS